MKQPIWKSLSMPAMAAILGAALLLPATSAQSYEPPPDMHRNFAEHNQRFEPPKGENIVFVGIFGGAIWCLFSRRCEP